MAPKRIRPTARGPRSRDVASCQAALQRLPGKRRAAQGRPASREGRSDPAECEGPRTSCVGAGRSAGAERMRSGSRPGARYLPARLLLSCPRLRTVINYRDSRTLFLDNCSPPLPSPNRPRWSMATSSNRHSETARGAQPGRRTMVSPPKTMADATWNASARSFQAWNRGSLSCKWWPSSVANTATIRY